jgi:hypothetical protein
MFRTVCKRLAVLIPVLLVGVTPGPRPVSANPAPPAGYQFCAWEGEHCGFGGTADVAYGAEGRFNYRNAVSGGVQCINEVFGDPNPGMRKACFIRPAVATPPAGYTFCAWEGEHCAFDGTADVAYGANGRFAHRNAVSGGVQCINEVFGDPNPGVRKACFIRPAAAPPPADPRPAPPAGYERFCAWEGEHCAFSGTADVAYGANGRFAYRNAVSGGIHCVNEVFGDPNPGVRKACFIRPAAAPPPADPRPAPPAGYERFCAWEGEHCAFSGTADVAYGANGRFAYRNAVSGGIHCVNEVFGDPNPGVRKACFIRPAAAPPPADPRPAPPAGYERFCAWEGEHCAFGGTADVAYGANGRFAHRNAVSGGVQCINEVFGDPNPGVRKACFIRPAAAPPPASPRPDPPAGYTFCAWEGGHCAFGGTADVAYGANGRFAHRHAVSGGVQCVNEVFGDPNPGVRKACFIRPAAAPPPANPPAPPPQPGCVAGNQVDKPAFFADVARRLRNPSVSEAALPFAVQAFLAWEPSENTAACWNPLATTLRYTRGPCRSQTLPGNTAGVQQYPSRECGIRATADTLNYTFNGNGRAYQAIRRMMAKQAFDEALLLQEVTRWVGSEAYARALVTRWRQLYFGR